MKKYDRRTYESQLDRDAVIECLNSGHSLSGMDMSAQPLGNIDFAGADLSASRLDFAWLKRTIFSDCQLSKTSFRNAMLDQSQFRAAVAPNARFASSYVRRSDFRSAELTGASFVRSTVVQTPFDSCTLYGSNLAGILLQNCSLRDVDFRKARAWRMWMVGCDCTGASFNGATMRGTAFNGCNLSDCTFDGADLRRCLITACQYDPSAIQQANLRNAEIMRPGEKRSVFICHAGEDKDFARKLSSDLKAVGIDVWIDEWKIKVGDSITGRIDNALTECDCVVVVLSESMLNKPWPMREFKSALMRQASGDGSFILPAKIDDSSLPALIQDIAYADFRDDYDGGLESLITGITEV